MNTGFTNSILLPENLPTLTGEVFNPIDRKYLRILIFNNILFTFIFIAPVWFFFFQSDGEINRIFPIAYTGLFLLILILSIVVSVRSFVFRGYLIRERDIAYQRGWLRYKLTSIPFNRIQHVELIQGILAKRLNLASIKVYTAGSGSDDLVIPGLPLDVALRMREFLTGKISRDE